MSLSYEKLYSIFGLVFSCSRLSHRVVVWGQERLQLGCSLQTTNRKRKIQLVGRAVSYHEPVTCQQVVEQPCSTIVACSAIVAMALSDFVDPPSRPCRVCS